MKSLVQPMSNALLLDPNPKNQLGKSLLPPTLEESLLDQGYVFASIVPKSARNSPITLLRCKRFIVDAVTDAHLDRPCHRDDSMEIVTYSPR
jgi:hypothetical protein